MKKFILKNIVRFLKPVTDESFIEYKYGVNEYYINKIKWLFASYKVISKPVSDKEYIEMVKWLEYNKQLYFIEFGSVIDYFNLCNYYEPRIRIFYILNKQQAIMFKTIWS